MCIRRPIFIIPLCALTIGTIIVSDQLTKHLASIHLDHYQPITIINGFLQLVLVHNPGAAFGILTDVPESIRTGILAVFSTLAFVLLVYLFRTRPAGSCLVPFGISLVSAGALGNIIDRIRLGYVIDFIDVFISKYHWPTFNLADSSITIGVGLLLIQMLFDNKEHHAS